LHYMDIPLQHGHPNVLKRMRRPANVDWVYRTLEKLRAAMPDLAIRTTFIVGYPGETVDSIEATFRLALDLPLDSISFNVPYPLPGSKLFERVSEIDMAKDWDKENEVTFIYKSEFDPVWLERRIQQTMSAFADKVR
jgi:anaerobic magnesium-protoporphyrin IX monomethyl ester cyclase